MLRELTVHILAEEAVVYPVVAEQVKGEEEVEEEEEGGLLQRLAELQLSNANTSVSQSACASAPSLAGWIFLQPPTCVRYPRHALTMCQTHHSLLPLSPYSYPLPSLRRCQIEEHMRDHAVDEHESLKLFSSDLGAW